LFLIELNPKPLLVPEETDTSPEPIFA